MAQRNFFEQKNILITGGSGSFGKALIRRLVERELGNKIAVFSRDEWKQWEMRRVDPLFQIPRMRYFLGDVRDPLRLKRAFEGVDIVIHAAALKQVPVAEYNPTEFIHTNIHGAMNVIDAAIDAGVKNVIALSTDKAVNPANLYGATKLCSDKLFVAANAYVGARAYPKFSVVRYGNVLGSRGSLIPHWKELVADGAKKLPVTDPRMTRFWITVNQAVDFVLDRIPTMRGGEVFVPKIPSMRIVDLAKALFPEIPLDMVGIRPGEKLHESLLSVEDARRTRELEDHYMILPEDTEVRKINEWQRYPENEGNTLPEDFAYRSDTNPDFLTIDQLKAALTKS